VQDYFSRAPEQNDWQEFNPIFGGEKIKICDTLLPVAPFVEYNRHPKRARLESWSVMLASQRRPCRPANRRPVDFEFLRQFGPCRVALGLEESHENRLAGPLN
jgi:hypothetical protein